MKNQFLIAGILLAFLTSPSTINAQENKYLIRAEKDKNHPFYEAAITLLDGTLLKGHARILHKTEVIEFVPNDAGFTDKPTTYDFSSAKGVALKIDDKITRFDYQIVQTPDGKHEVRILEAIHIGPVNLYTFSISHTVPNTFFMMASPGMSYSSFSYFGTGDYTHDSQKYYISKRSEGVIRPITVLNPRSKQFEPIADWLFGDCPDLIQKLKDDYFTKKEIEEVVAYYNNKCQ